MYLSLGFCSIVILTTDSLRPPKETSRYTATAGSYLTEPF